MTTQMITSEIALTPTTTRARTMKWYETGSRYVLGLIFLFGAIDGAMFLLFGIYIHGRPREAFLIALQQSTYFWTFMKLIQFLGAASLLTNYKPALGVALLIPVASVLVLFYFFELPQFVPVGLIIAASVFILCRAYAKSYTPLFDDYAR